MSSTPVEKYLRRVDELQSLQVELKAGRRPGDLGPVAGRVLEAAGDLLRRSAKVSFSEGQVRETLALLPEPALVSFCSGLDLSELTLRLEQAASQAVEAALPDEGEDTAPLMTWALQALQSRDRLESALVALEAIAVSGRGDAKVLHERLAGALQAVDVAARRRVRSFTALNDARRAEAALLTEPASARAWWFVERNGLGDDLLVKVLGGEVRGFLGPAERGAHEAVLERHERSVGFDELFAFDAGLATPAEAAALKARAAREPALAEIFAAMAAGEEAIAQLTDEGPGPDAVRPAPPSAPGSSRGAEVISERTEFRVLLFRNRAQLQVVVQPRRLERFAAAAVFLSDRPERALPHERRDEGLVFAVGQAERLAGLQARVVVTLSDGQQVASEIRL
jgi:hypothetical protein